MWTFDIANLREARAVLRRRLNYDRIYESEDEVPNTLRRDDSGVRADADTRGGRARWFQRKTLMTNGVYEYDRKISVYNKEAVFRSGSHGTVIRRSSFRSPSWH